MTNYVRNFPLLRPKTTESSYIGHTKEYEEVGTIRAHISPASDNYSIATYGERATKLYNIITQVYDIKDGDKIIIGGEECKIISTMYYSTHVVATAERTGIYGH